MYLVSAMALSLLFGLLSAEAAQAYVWHCHTPKGEIWTDHPEESWDCEEYDQIYNPSAAPPPGQSLAPPPAAPPSPPPYAWSYAPYPWAYP